MTLRNCAFIVIAAAVLDGIAIALVAHNHATAGIIAGLIAMLGGFAVLLRLVENPNG